MDFAPDDTSTIESLKLPYPYFGGKSTIMHEVWARFGNVPNFVDPFMGGISSILTRPHANPGIETVNDLDCYVANFSRALKHAPAEVAKWADSQVNEADLHARHLWLVSRSEFRNRMRTDPDYYDAKIAGYWVWGICSWIGSGWCDEKKYSDEMTYAQFLRGEIEVAKPSQQRPALCPPMGIHRPSQQLPHLSGAGQGIHRSGETDIYGYMQSLSNRLRRVRVCCGDWTRVLGDSPTVKLGMTGIFLDPPYSHAVRDKSLYGMERDVSGAVREWAIANGDNPLLRIALAGYFGEHELPDSWECFAWKASGGFGNQGDGEGKTNAKLERIWFSPHCLKIKKQWRSMNLFEEPA